MRSDEIYGVTNTQLQLLYAVISLTLFYMIFKYKKSSLYLFIIFLFYPSIFIFLGSTVQNLYKVGMLLFCLGLCHQRRVFKTIGPKEKWISLSFLIFTISLFISVILNSDYFTIAFSQYSRYLIIFCLFFLLKKEILNPKYDSFQLSDLIYNLLLMQIIVSVAKFFITGVKESLVGTLSHTGGAEATILPILAFIYFWFTRKGKLTRRDYLFIASFLFLGFLAGKRAVWFIMPIIIGLFIYYVPKRKFTNTLWIGVALLPLVFFLGVKLTPTLNPENIVWGKFDIDFALNYAETYSFGDSKKKERNVSQGRGGATVMLFRNLMRKELDENDFWGYGFDDMYGTNYEEFDKKNFGVNHKGSATGVFQSYITMGYIGVFTTIFFALSTFANIANKRLKYVIIIIFCWEYIFYTGLIIRTPIFMFLLFYIVINSTYLQQPWLKHEKQQM